MALLMCMAIQHQLLPPAGVLVPGVEAAGNVCRQHPPGAGAARRQPAGAAAAVCARGESSRPVALRNITP